MQPLLKSKVVKFKRTWNSHVEAVYTLGLAWVLCFKYINYTSQCNLEMTASKENEKRFFEPQRLEYTVFLASLGSSGCPAR